MNLSPEALATPIGQQFLAQQRQVMWGTSPVTDGGPMQAPQPPKRRTVSGDMVTQLSGQRRKRTNVGANGSNDISRGSGMGAPTNGTGPSGNNAGGGNQGNGPSAGPGPHGGGGSGGAGIGVGSGVPGQGSIWDAAAENARRQLEDQFAAANQGYADQRSLLNAQFRQNIARFRTDEGFATDRHNEDVAGRGIVNSGVNSQLYNRDIAVPGERYLQDLSTARATGLSDIATGRAQNRLNYHQGLDELLLGAAGRSATGGNLGISHSRRRNT